MHTTATRHHHPGKTSNETTKHWMVGGQQGDSMEHAAKAKEEEEGK